MLPGGIQAACYPMPQVVENRQLQLQIRCQQISEASLIHLCFMQVTLESWSRAAPLSGQPCLWLQMRGPEGVTEPLQFQGSQWGQTEAFACSAAAVGGPHQLSLWLDPNKVSPSMPVNLPHAAYHVNTLLIVLTLQFVHEADVTHLGQACTFCEARCWHKQSKPPSWEIIQCGLELEPSCLPGIANAFCVKARSGHEPVLTSAAWLQFLEMLKCM